MACMALEFRESWNDVGPLTLACSLWVLITVCFDLFVRNVVYTAGQSLTKPDCCSS